MAETKDLSEREREILCLVAKGASNKQIAQELYISSNTVKVHLRNIFSKIGVSSRTEAAMYAVSTGLVEPGGAAEGENLDSEAAGSTRFRLRDQRLSKQQLWMIGLIIGAITIIVAGIFFVWQRTNGTFASGPQLDTEEFPRWQGKADMITPRQEFGVTTYANQVFAIGGEVDDVVLNVVERYDPSSDQWESLAPKPLAVANVSAVTVGGEIYVPGGRLESGRMTNVLEVYDPEENRWFQRAPLPVSLSAYALVAYEGSIYMFGGWDGENYTASTYEYKLATDEWVELSPMSKPRAFFGAAVAGEKIYVVGGINDEGVLDVNEVYQPALEGDLGGPWSTATPLPEARYAMGVASVADIIHIIGGIGEAGVDQYSMVYFPNSGNWEEFINPFSGNWSNLGLVPLESRLYAFGGLLEGKITSQNLVYQAIYTVLFPVVK
jgi:DNA-binding CsgD family transcriptional regulator/N-acetylneuraminic acid mutarotase